MCGYQILDCRILTGVHDSLVSQLQQKTKLRVHAVGLLGGDAEEGGIELRQVLQLAGSLRQAEHTYKQRKKQGSLRYECYPFFFFILQDLSAVPQRHCHSEPGGSGSPGLRPALSRPQGEVTAAGWRDASQSLLLYPGRLSITVRTVHPGEVHFSQDHCRPLS